MKNSILILLVSVALYSCGNEREESMEKTEECLEDKYDDELSKLETIEEALTAYDFVSARTLLACYEDACYKNDDLQNDCPKFRDGYNQISKETKKEWADRKSQQNQHFKMEYKIVYAEVTYFLNNGAYAKAIASANESDLFFIYKNQLPATVNKWVDENKFDLALKVLSTYTFTEMFEKETTNNSSYISEINAYNDMLYSVLNSAIFDSNSNALKKVLLLVKPTAILDKNGPKLNDNPKHSILSDKPKEDMKKKIKEAGIVL